MPTLPPPPVVVHLGLDIAKASLQLDLHDRSLALPNTPAGHAQLLLQVRARPGAHLICEATGGYERAVVVALQAAAVPVSVVNPAQVRHFALAQGQRAKNDPLDACLLSAYGKALQPAATLLPDAALAELRALVQWRAQLMEQRNTLRNHAEHATLPYVLKAQARTAAQLDKQIAAAEAEMSAVLKRAPQWVAPVAKLEARDGVGRLTAISVLSQMPELGHLNRGEAAALAGLAPWTRQSGPWEGQRHIGGGRAAVRRALYMSAVGLARMKTTTLGKFYAHLRAAGKPAKVALTAVMRKLLLQMNHELKPA